MVFVPGDPMATQAADLGRRPSRVCGPRAVATMLVCVAATVVAHAIDLEPRTSQAFDAYLGRATKAFVARAQAAPRTLPAQKREPSAGPGGQDGIISVPGGLIHHWIASTFIPGASLQRALEVASAYDDYRRFYESVIASRVLAHDGNTYRVLMRLREGESGITAVLDVRSTVRYVFPANGVAYAISNADVIREVVNAGEKDERLLPPGQDSGYLWRASTFTSFAEVQGGVYVEMETLGLSRRFPPLLGWIIEPIARRIGRRSAERSLREFVAAVNGGDGGNG